MTSPKLPGDPKLRGGAAWCDQHQRWECTRKAKSTQARCHFSAIRGLDRCRMHAGERASVAKAKGAAVSAWTALSGHVTVSATEAVLGMLQMSWLRVHLYAQLLQQQVDAAQAEAAREPAIQVADEVYGVIDHEAGGAPPVGHGVGLVGQTYSGVKDIGIFATGEAIRGLAQLEATERDRCVKFAKTAHDMGIAEQQISIAEAQGTLFADAFFRILDALDLSPGQQAKAVEVMPRELRAIEGGTG